MEYLKIMILSMVPITELRGAIPIGMALKLNPIGVYLSSVIGSTLVAIPLVLAYRHVVKFFKEKNMFLFLLRRVDNKIEKSMKKMKAASFIASILRMRLIEALSGIFIGNILSGLIVSLLSYHIL